VGSDIFGSDLGQQVIGCGPSQSSSRPQSARQSRYEFRLRQELWRGGHHARRLAPGSERTKNKKVISQFWLKSGLGEGGPWRSLWDAAANLSDASRNRGSAKNQTQAIDVVVSVLTAVAVVVVAPGGMNATLGVSVPEPHFRADAVGNRLAALEDLRCPVGDGPKQRPIRARRRLHGGNGGRDPDRGHAYPGRTLCRVRGLPFPDLYTTSDNRSLCAAISKSKLTLTLAYLRERLGEASPQLCQKPSSENSMVNTVILASSSRARWRGRSPDAL
jgi:hypothetical protein